MVISAAATVTPYVESYKPLHRRQDVCEKMPLHVVVYNYRNNFNINLNTMDTLVRWKR